MKQIKYFDLFFEDKSDSEAPFPNEADPIAYDESEGAYLFEYLTKNLDRYDLRVVPAMDIFTLTLPAGDFLTCAFSALHKNRDYFQRHEDGLIFSWLIRIVTYFKHRESIVDNGN